MLALRKNIEVHYLVCTDVKITTPTFTPRYIINYKIRDLVKEPLTVKEFLARPFIRRGRYLTTSKDLKTGSFKHFYISSTREYWRDTPLRICVFNEISKKPEAILTHHYGSTVRDRKLLIKIARDYLEPKFEPGYRLGIFADDLQVIG